MKKILKSFLVLACLIVLPLSGYAAQNINQFSFVLDSGKVSFDSTAKVLKGTDISVATLTLINGGVTQVFKTNATLSFEANFILDAMGLYKFGNGGYMDINGEVIDSTNNVISSGNLLNAKSFDQNVFSWSPSSTIQSFTLSTGNATLENNLDNLLSLDSGTIYQSSSLLVNFKAPTAFNTSFAGVNIDKGVAQGSAPVPIPAAAWLFLSGIAGIAGLRRKNKK